MVQMYTIAGRQVGSHILAIATLGTTFGLSAYFMRGKPAAEKAAGPPIAAKSSEEESFVKDFIAKAEDKAKSVAGQ